MLTPNSVGTLYRRTGYDSYGQSKLAAGVECPYSPVDMRRTAQPTIVRADSSASRGQADEMVSQARILVVTYMNPSIDDHFHADGINYRIVSVFPRKTVMGRLDHFECDLEILP